MEWRILLAFSFAENCLKSYVIILYNITYLLRMYAYFYKIFTFFYLLLFRFLVKLYIFHWRRPYSYLTTLPTCGGLIQFIHTHKTQETRIYYYCFLLTLIFPCVCVNSLQVKLTPYIYISPLYIWLLSLKNLSLHFMWLPRACVF